MPHFPDSMPNFAARAYRWLWHLRSRPFRQAPIARRRSASQALLSLSFLALLSGCGTARLPVIQTCPPIPVELMEPAEAPLLLVPKERASPSPTHGPTRQKTPNEPRATRSDLSA